MSHYPVGIYYIYVMCVTLSLAVTTLCVIPVRERPGGGGCVGVGRKLGNFRVPGYWIIYHCSYSAGETCGDHKPRVKTIGRRVGGREEIGTRETCNTRIRRVWRGWVYTQIL